MHDEGINHRLIIDCSHGNSGKVAERQISVAREVIDNRKKMPGYVAGIMLESFYKVENNQTAFRESMVSLLLMSVFHGNRQNNYYQLWQHNFNFNYSVSFLREK